MKKENKNKKSKIIIGSIFILATLSIYAEEQTGKLGVEAKGFRNDKGWAILYIYRKKDNIKENGYISIKKDIKEGISKFMLENIEYGEYGVKVVHDENGNGKMDVGIFGVEGVGFSREIKINRNMVFEDIKTFFNPDNSKVSVKVQYPTLAEIIAESSKTK